ncbi:MAG: hypothetical protein AB4058_21700 [Microcystaceae cyanobacterium]
MFESTFNQLSTSDISYIWKHIKQIQKQPEFKLNSLWRIASNADLFSVEEFNSEGVLTSEQVQTTMQFIREFQRQFSHQFL